jgi:hypothetical protein
LRDEEPGVEDILSWRNIGWSAVAESTKKNWLFFCDKLMPCVNDTWRLAAVRRTKNMEDVCSAGDEAFVMYVIKTYRDKWMNPPKIEGSNGTVTTSSEATEKNVEGERTMDDQAREELNSIFNIVKERRKGVDYSGWSNAIRKIGYKEDVMTNPVSAIFKTVVEKKNKVTLEWDMPEDIVTYEV